MNSGFDFMALLIAVLIVLVILVITMELVKWYVCYVAKINQRIKLMERQNYLLSRLAQKLGVDEQYLINDLPELRKAEYERLRQQRKQKG
jgi:hypothetical protein